MTRMVFWPTLRCVLAVGADGPVPVGNDVLDLRFPDVHQSIHSAETHLLVYLLLRLVTAVSIGFLSRLLRPFLVLTYPEKLGKDSLKSTHFFSRAFLRLAFHGTSG